MLETRMPPSTTRTRRSHSSAQPAPSPGTRPAAPQTRVREQSPREQAAAPAIRRPLPSARTSRLARSEMRLMGLATACTAVVCALLLLYLAAYAHVTQLGIEESQARAVLRQNQVRNELLQAERNTLESPQRITAAAVAQGMIPRGSTPIDYVAARPEPTEAAQSGAEMASNSDQGNSVGTTETAGAAASFNH